MGRFDRIDRTAFRGAVAVITGQQPGLFSGPIYTILKAITVVKLARALEDRGVRAVPVFWIAAEDHDYLEIESASILDRDSQLQELRVDLSNRRILAGRLAASAG